MTLCVSVVIAVGRCSPVCHSVALMYYIKTA